MEKDYLTENVVDFQKYRRYHDPSVIRIGDCIEWKNYDGEKKVGFIKRIEYRPYSRSRHLGNPITSVRIFECYYVTFVLEGELFVIGEIVTRKIRKSEQPKRPRKF